MGKRQFPPVDNLLPARCARGKFAHAPHDIGARTPKLQPKQQALSRFAAKRHIKAHRLRLHQRTPRPRTQPAFPKQPADKLAALGNGSHLARAAAYRNHQRRRMAATAAARYAAAACAAGKRLLHFIVVKGNGILLPGGAHNAAVAEQTIVLARGYAAYASFLHIGSAPGKISGAANKSARLRQRKHDHILLPYPFSFLHIIAHLCA